MDPTFASHPEPERNALYAGSDSQPRGPAGRTIVLGGFGYGVGPDGRGVDLDARRGDSLSETLRTDYVELD